MGPNPHFCKCKNFRFYFVRRASYLLQAVAVGTPLSISGKKSDHAAAADRLDKERTAKFRVFLFHPAVKSIADRLLICREVYKWLLSDSDGVAAIPAIPGDRERQRVFPSGL